MSIKNAYEVVLVFSVKQGEEATAALVEKFKTMITENATDVTVDEWGKRRLAYPISDLTEGYYVLINFKSGTDFPAELERVYGITEGVIRDIVIKSEEA